MSKLIIIFLFVTKCLLGISQNEFVIETKLIEVDKLEITLQNNVIQGPVRLKLDKSITKVELLHAQRGKLIKDKGNWVIVWSAIPEQQKIALLIKAKLTTTTNSIGILSYLKEGERANQTIFRTTNKNENIVSKPEIPEKFKPLDTDKNHFISALEINQAINGFFDQTNNLEVADLTKLINYFFEQ